MRKNAFCSTVVVVATLIFSTPILAAPRATPLEPPLVFEPNRGHVAPEVKWLARGQGFQVFITDDSMTLALWERAGQGAENSARPRMRGAGSDSRVGVLRTRLSGSRAWNAVGLEPTGGISNYFIGDDPRRWFTQVSHYRRLKITEVYPGIDLMLYGRGGQLEYDIVVRPGADPNQIRLSFSGADRTRVDATTGDLLLTMSSGAELRTHQPRIYQEIGGRRVEVAGSYALLATGEVAFRLASYDASRRLVIDPTVSFTTFLEGGAMDDARGVAVDPSGNSYVAGSTSSADFPTLNGLNVASKMCSAASAAAAAAAPSALCTTYAFVAKLSPAGVILFSTYLGGSGVDFGHAVAADATGAYVAGGTTSVDFPAFFTSYQKTGINGNTRPDAFVTKLSPEGSILYSSIWGGTGGDQAFAITVDASRSVYVAGSTDSTDYPISGRNFPAPTLPMQSTLGGRSDGFVTKLDPNGLIYGGFSTYLGGSLEDEADGIAVDRGGFVYVAGLTFSANFPSVGPSFGKPTGGTSGTFTAFVTKLVPNGTGVLYSLTMGGGFDFGNAIAVGFFGEAYVTGRTASPAFPTTTAAFQRNKPSPVQLPNNGPLILDAFVAVISPGGLLRYATYLGGTNGFGSSGDSIGVNLLGEIYVGGFTFASDFPGPSPSITPNPTAGFLVKLDPELRALRFRMYLGAEIHSIAIPPPRLRDFILSFGRTEIYTAGLRWRPNTDVTNANNVDAFVVKVVDALLPVFAP